MYIAEILKKTSRISQSAHSLRLLLPFTIDASPTTREPGQLAATCADEMSDHLVPER